MADGEIIHLLVVTM